MSQKWNLQDIKPAQPRKRQPTIPTQKRTEDEPSQEASITSRERESIPNIIIQKGRNKGGKSVIIALVLFFVIILGALGLSALLGKTEITIYPEFREPNLNSEFTAFPDKQADSLSYEVLTLESTAESQVKASGQVEVKEQATGIIDIIKTTPGTERLIKNTRFRSPSGQIYRIEESVVVPGSVQNNDGVSVPGTIKAKVFADESGDSYNLDAGTRFNIPGFEEGGFTDLYNAIYAENRQPIEGGFEGPQFQIDDKELATARQALQTQLRSDLLLRVESEKPTGFITFPGAVAITYKQLPAVESTSDLVTIREQAVLQIPIFKTSDFGSFLAKETVATYSGGTVRVDDPSALEFSYSSSTTSSSVIANEPSITFTLKGKPLLIWEYDIDKLTKDLAGLPKTAINNAITAYPGIDGARVSITPFWKRTFPVDAEEIIVTEELKRE